MADVDVAALRALAEAASPGPWLLDADVRVAEDGRVAFGLRAADMSEWESVVEWCGDERIYAWPADAAYLAAVDPTAVLALLDRLSAAESAVDRIRALAAKMLNENGMAWNSMSGRRITRVLEGGDPLPRLEVSGG